MRTPRANPVILITLALVLTGCDAFIGGPQKATTLRIDPESLTVAEGSDVALRLTLLDSRGAEMPTPIAPTLDIHDVSVAVYSFPGLYGATDVDTSAYMIHGVMPGSTVVEARAAGLTARATLTVVPAVVKSITVSPNPVGLKVGQSMLLAVASFDAKGNYLFRKAPTFQSRNGHALVDAGGRVTGVTPGTDTITATVEAATADVEVRVTVAPSSAALRSSCTPIEPGRTRAVCAPTFLPAHHAPWLLRTSRHSR